MVYTGDSIPTAFESEQAKGVDVFLHELFIDAPTFAEKNNMPPKLEPAPTDGRAPEWVQATRFKKNQ